MNDFSTDPARGCAPGAIHPDVGPVNPDLFFSDSLRDLNDAKRVCADCPVRRPCGAYADREGMTYGVWAGINRSPNGAHRRSSPIKDQAAARRAAAAQRRTAIEAAVRVRWGAGQSDGIIGLALDLNPSTVASVRARLGLAALYGPAGRRLHEVTQ
jgi:WhiB family redox-sensing transcriptional regulator